MQEEIWKPIADAEGYEISNLGRVRSFKQRSTGRLLKPRPILGSLYLHVVIISNNKKKPFTIHRLVAKAFIPNPQNKPQVNHINGVKTDNRAENLEWATASENQQHAFDTGLQTSLSGNNPDELTGKALAKMFGVAATTISDVQRGKIWKTVGGNIREAHGNNLTTNKIYRS